MLVPLLALLGGSLGVGQFGGWSRQCAGPFLVPGDPKPLYLVFSPSDSETAKARTSTSGEIMLGHNVRLYLARECSLTPQAYAAWSLVGKSFAFSVDLGGAGCGCNVAVYLTSMAQNLHAGTCGGDYYCDANSLCGHRCPEVDLFEANTHAIHATAHRADDPAGNGAGLGGVNTNGNVLGVTELAEGRYGPGASLIDTKRKFRVRVAFEPDSKGVLSAITVHLTQEDRVVSFPMATPAYSRSLHPFLDDGMTLILAFWSSRDLEWFQGGVCTHSEPNMCQLAQPTVSSFAIEPHDHRDVLLKGGGNDASTGRTSSAAQPQLREDGDDEDEEDDDIFDLFNPQPPSPLPPKA